MAINYGLFGQFIEHKSRNPRHYELIDWGNLIPWDQYQYFLAFYLSNSLHGCFLDLANRVKFQSPRLDFWDPYGGKEFPNLAYCPKTDIFQSRSFLHRITARDGLHSPPSK